MLITTYYCIGLSRIIIQLIDFKLKLDFIIITEGNRDNLSQNMSMIYHGHRWHAAFSNT